MGMLASAARWQLFNPLRVVLFERNWWFSTSRHIVSTNAIGWHNQPFFVVRFSNFQSFPIKPPEPEAEADASFASRQVTRALEAIIVERGAPQVIRCDDGPELTSRHFLAWCIERKIELAHIQPGRPMQNGQVESFHGKLGDECLRVSWFGNLFEARRKIAAWRIEYNQERPHSSLGYGTPEKFARAIGAAEGCVKAAPGKTNNRFPLRLGIPPNTRDSHFPTATAATFSPPPSRITLRMSYYDPCGNRGRS